MTSQVLQTMLSRVSKEEERVRADRDRFEKSLSYRKEAFLQEITTFQQKTEGLKTYTSVFLSKEANECEIL